MRKPRPAPTLTNDYIGTVREGTAHFQGSAETIVHGDKFSSELGVVAEFDMDLYRTNDGSEGICGGSVDCGFDVGVTACSRGCYRW